MYSADLFSSAGAPDAAIFKQEETPLSTDLHGQARFDRWWRSRRLDYRGLSCPDAREAFAQIRGQTDYRCSTLPTNRELIATARDRAFGPHGEGSPPSRRGHLSSEAVLTRRHS
jgi:hypothetical protein